MEENLVGLYGTANAKLNAESYNMLGAIIGDIVGSRFEFNPSNNYNFDLFHSDCEYTDDTICTIAIADAIIKRKNFGRSLQKWCRRYPDPMGGYGEVFFCWVWDNNPKPYGSFGNGAAMRVSSVGWVTQSEKNMLQMARETAVCTHNHPEGIKGAETVARLIYEFVKFRRKNIKLTNKVVNRILDRCATIAEYNIDIDESLVKNKFDVTCQGTVPVALWIIRESISFEDALRKAVSLGADADTLGAIVGSIAEAIWGIPYEIQVEALNRLPEDMKKVVIQFYKRYIKKSYIASLDFGKQNECYSFIRRFIKKVFNKNK